MIRSFVAAAISTPPRFVLAHWMIGSKSTRAIYLVIGHDQEVRDAPGGVLERNDRLRGQRRRRARSGARARPDHGRLAVARGDRGAARGLPLHRADAAARRPPPSDARRRRPL